MSCKCCRKPKLPLDERGLCNDCIVKLAGYYLIYVLEEYYQRRVTEDKVLEVLKEMMGRWGKGR